MALISPVGGGGKREDLAGQTVYDPSTGMNVSYNENGYYSGSKRPGVAADTPYRAPSEDAVSGSDRTGYGGSEYDKQYFTDAELENADYYRKLASSGAITWDEANQYVESIRKKYGYTGGSQGDQYNPYTGAWDRGSGWGLGGGLSGSGSGSGGSSGTGSGGVNGIDRYDPSGLKNTLDRWLQQAQQQQQAAIDYQVDKGVQDLRRQEEESNEQFQTMRDQVALDEAKAKDNQALYAEARGDKGGIGAAQYDSIMNTAAQNRLAVNQQQVKVASEVARQITDLRAQGEFEKADALLSLSQNYLSQLMSLEQWSAEYNLNVDQFNAGLEQWRQEFNASLQQWDASFGLQLGQLMGTYNGQPTLSGQQWAYEKDQMDKSTLSSAGSTLLSAGILPSQSQLDAMGMTVDQAKSYISALKATSGGGTPGKDSGKLPANNPPSGPDYDGLFEAAQAAGGSIKNFLSSAANYKKYGFSGSTDLYNQYETWLKNGGSSPQLSFDEDEGTFTFNGVRYARSEDLESAFRNAGLTEGQKEELRRKLALYQLASDYLG